MSLFFPFPLVLNNKMKAQIMCNCISLTLSNRPDPLSNSKHPFWETWTLGNQYCAIYISKPILSGLKSIYSLHSTEFNGDAKQHFIHLNY